jgi:CDP-L-myo-inositol myo-inositolphosphotransferase
LPRLGIVLAAGRSERLSSVTGGGSKALLRLGGMTLVERAVRGLLRAGVQDVVVVLGYQAGPVAAVVKRIAPRRVRTVLARDWKSGNGASLLAAERVVKDELFMLVTMDHIFSETALAPVVRAGEPAVLVDDAPSDEVWAEGTRVRLRRGAAVAFSKQLRTRRVDCGAFLLPRAVFDAVREVRAAGDHSLAGAVTALAATHPLRAASLPPRTWWQDIDTPRDLSIAKRRLRRSLSKYDDGPVSRYLNRPISTRIAMPLAAIGISPDLLSVISALLGFLGAWLLGSGVAIAGAIAVHACSVLDGVDGEVARLRMRSSARGALFDGTLDRLADAALVGGLAVWAVDEGAAPTTVVLLAVAAATVSMLSMASKDRIAALALLPAPERRIGWLLGGRDGRLLVIAVLGAFAQPSWALAVIAVSGSLALIVRLTTVLRQSS